MNEHKYCFTACADAVVAAGQCDCHNRNNEASMTQNSMLGEVTFEAGMVYYAHHIPTDEDWVLLGIDRKQNQVCAAGWPASIARLSDCCRFEKRGPITEEERRYRDMTFGSGWL